MNTFIEEIATVFGWSEADYSKDDLLDYYRANVTNNATGISDSNLAIEFVDSDATRILKEFVRLYIRAENYMDQNQAFIFIVNDSKACADFKALAIDANRKRSRFGDDNNFHDYFKDLYKNTRIVPLITA